MMEGAAEDMEQAIKKLVEDMKEVTETQSLYLICHFHH